MPRFRADDLTDFATALFAAADVPHAEARRVAESLVLANLRGHDSHGVMRIPSYVEQLRTGELVAGAALQVLSETPATVRCDAGFGFGQVQAHRLLDRAIEKARNAGVACAAAKNCGHVGRLGEFTERAAMEGLAAFATVNDNGVLRVVAPPGGIEPRISTNPISLAVPTGDCPLVFDASTSAVAQGKVLVKQLADQPCPEGWLQDSRGNPTTDPHVLHANPTGTLLPLGGPMAYKGFGLAMLLDVLAGGLSGGFCPPPRAEAKMCNSVVLVVWDADLFAGAEHLRRQASELIASVRDCPRKQGVDRIRIPGDTSAAVEEERRRSGIPLSAGNWDSLARLAEQLGSEPPRPADGSN